MTDTATSPATPLSREQALILKVVGRNSGRCVVFMKLRDVYPECEFLIEGAPQLFPLRCIRDDGCPRNANCMGVLAHRIKYIFDTFDDADLLLLYFSYPDMPGSQRAGIFRRDMSEPRYLTLNRTVWSRMKQIGAVYQWQIPQSLFLTKTATQSLM